MEGSGVTENIQQAVNDAAQAVGHAASTVINAPVDALQAEKETLGTAAAETLENAAKLIRHLLGAV